VLPARRLLGTRLRVAEILLMTGLSGSFGRHSAGVDVLPDRANRMIIG
jgi:hypothetical protein